MKTCLILLLGLLGFLPVRGDQAQTVEIPGEGFTIDLPPGWTTSFKPGAALYAQNRGAVLLIKAVPNDDDKVLHSDDLREIAGRLWADGNVTDMNPPGKVSLHGVPAYSSWVQLRLHNQTGYARFFLIPANHKVYGVIMASEDGEEDSAFQRIGNSVQFESPPDIPWDWMSLDYQKFIPYFGFAFFAILLFWGFQSAGDFFDRFFPTRFDRVHKSRGGGYS